MVTNIAQLMLRNLIFVLQFIDKVTVGQHHMRGIIKKNPSLPKYKELLDIDNAINYLKGWSYT